jgi:hypothetical protein
VNHPWSHAGVVEIATVEDFLAFSGSSSSLLVAFLSSGCGVIQTFSRFDLTAFHSNALRPTPHYKQALCLIVSVSVFASFRISAPLASACL